MTNLPSNITATLRLTQKGLRGPIHSSVDFTSDSEAPSNGFASHVALAELDMQLQPALAMFSGPEAKDDDTEYKLTFTLAQEKADGDVYSSIILEPRVASTDPKELPMSYQIGCQVMLNWLHMVGVLNDEGELDDDEKFARVDIHAGATVVH